jgi:hypothetical protein
LAARSNSSRCRTAIAPEGGSVMARRIVRRKGQACGVRESDRRGWASCAGPHNHNTRLSPDDVAFGSRAALPECVSATTRVPPIAADLLQRASRQPWAICGPFALPGQVGYNCSPLRENHGAAEPQVETGPLTSHSGT